MLKAQCIFERSLGLPDGAFANRPHPWLDVPLCSIRWPIDHRTAVTTIYAASAALWAYGVIAPSLEFARYTYFQLYSPLFYVANSAIAVSMLAFSLTIVLTLWATFALEKYKKNRAKTLREWADETVSKATGVMIEDIAKDEALLKLCVNLSDEKIETIKAR